MRPGSEVVKHLYSKKEDVKRESLSKKAYSSSREREQKSRIARLTLITSDSSVMSQSEKGGGS